MIWQHPPLNVQDIVDGLPDLTQLSLPITSGRWSGKTLQFTPNNGFQGELRSAEEWFEFAIADGSENHSVTEASADGSWTLEGIYPSSISTENGFKGWVLSIKLSKPHQPQGRTVLRHYRTNRSKRMSDVFLPEKSTFHGATNQFAVAYFEIAGRKGTLALIPEGRGILYELELGSGDSDGEMETLEKHLHHVDRFLQLLFGQEWGEEFARQTFDPSAKTPCVTEWKRVKPRTTMGEALIPTDYSEVSLAMRAFPDRLRHPVIEFERLWPCIAKLVSEPDLVVPIDLMVQINDLPLNTRGTLLAIALEALTSIISKELGLLAEPAIPRRLWTTTEEKLLAMINELPALSGDSVLDANRKAAIRRKLQNLPQPSNAEKLKRPFEFYGIELSVEDLEALERRNRALHTGRIDNTRSMLELTPEYWSGVALVERRLKLAVSKLLLKHMGYSGPILNWAHGREQLYPPDCAWL